jgi:hypothetical protein
LSSLLRRQVDLEHHKPISAVTLMFLPHSLPIDSDCDVCRV